MDATSSSVSAVRTAAPRIAHADVQVNDFEVRWADSEAEVREAQRLRFQVFAQEMGAQLPAASSSAGLDVDRFDAYCDHLIVRSRKPGPSGVREVLGTYRVLSPSQARRAGGCYSDSEFDLAALAPLRAGAVELGRSCVHAQWRRGGVMMAMWGALAAYMQRRELHTMFGCASVSMNDGGASAVALWLRLAQTHLAPLPWRARPWMPLGGTDAVDALADRCAATEAAQRAEAPPLIKGYLRCGARLLGPPALDRAFHTADLPMMLRLGDMTARYRRHFLGTS